MSKRNYETKKVVEGHKFIEKINLGGKQDYKYETALHVFLIHFFPQNVWILKENERIDKV